MKIVFKIYRFFFLVRRYTKREFFVLWNRLFFWIVGVEYEENMRIQNKFYLNIDKDSKIKIGKNFTFHLIEV